MKYVKAVFGRIPKENLSKLKKYKKELIEFIPCTEENKYVWGLYLTPVSMADKVDQLFSRLYFEKSTLTGIDMIPSKKLVQLEANIEVLEKTVEEYTDKIEKFAENNKEEIIKYLKVTKIGDKIHTDFGKFTNQEEALKKLTATNYFPY